jgi:magnesium chelatase family protein
VDYEKLSGDRLGEKSETIRARVEKARERQHRRFAGMGDHKGSPLQCNGDMGPAEVRQNCAVDDAGKNLLRAAMQQMQLSARAYHRILKLARTIADLADSDKIETPHLAEAIQYRPRKQI